MANTKSQKPKVLPALIALAVMLVAGFGFYGMVSSFSGNSKIVVENWTGDLIEAAGDTAEEALGGLVHLAREQFAEGIDTTLVTFGDSFSPASGARNFTAKELCDNSLVRLDGDGYASAQPQRFPTGTSIIQNCLPNIGDSRKVMFWNESVDEAPSINFTTNAFLDAWIASSSAGLVVEIPVDRGVWVKMLNFDGSSVSLTFEEVRDSD